MKVIVFGGSGLTGQQVLASGLERGHTLTAFARTASKLDGLRPRVRVIGGDVAEYASVRHAIAGHDAVISTLGVGKPLSHDQAVIDGVSHILRAMKDEHIRRFVYLSFAGVQELTGWAIVLRPLLGFVLRHEIADHAEKERLIRASDRDWTIVHAPKLTNGSGRGTIRVGASLRSTGMPLLARADLAAGIWQILEDSSTTRQAVRVLP
jgi:putative NADH-flavin reductase